jgi:hypothetical protein
LSSNPSKRRWCFFASCGSNEPAVWWIQLGIRPERIMPGRPDQNGRHGRMQSPLKAETTKPPRSSFGAQQRAFDRFQVEYNELRPHEALGQVVPAYHHRRSPRRYPGYLTQVQYPAHFETRLAYPNGVLSFGATQWYVSACVAGQRLGLEPIDGGSYRVIFGEIALGLLDPRRFDELRQRRFGRLLPINDGATSLRRRRPYRR